MSAAQNLCPGCMSDQSGIRPCPSCSWDAASYLDNPLSLRPGHLLNNRYTIGKVIGVGGFGIVYIAWDNNLDIRAAIKEFLPKEYAARSFNHVSIAPYTGSADTDFSLGVEKFLEEAKALARFQEHPGIVTVHESFRANNTAYMVMQYLDGMTLKEYLKLQPGEKIAFNVAVKAMIPIMDALREVHNAGFVHRDISPDNIFLTSQKQVKLLDFGSARYAIGEYSKSLTSVLKHGYAPVEQYSVKGRQGPWSDVYAVCATIYRCVTGFAPLDAMERVQGDTIKTPKQFGIDLPLSGEVALMRGLALKAIDRFENIQQLQQALAIGEIPAQQTGQAGSRAELIRAIQGAEVATQRKPNDPTEKVGPEDGSSRTNSKHTIIEDRNKTSTQSQVKSIFQIKNVVALAIILVCMSISYYFLVTIPNQNKAKIAMEQKRLDDELKEKQQKEYSLAQEKQQREDRLFDCRVAAEKRANDYLALNGVPVEGQPGVYRAHRDIIAQFHRMSQEGEAGCYRQYGNLR